MIHEFFDSRGRSMHDQFQAWRENHQDGVLLAFATKSRAYSTVLDAHILAAARRTSCLPKGSSR